MNTVLSSHAGRPASLSAGHRFVQCLGPALADPN